MKYSEFKKQFQKAPYFTQTSLRLLNTPIQTLQNQLRLWEKRGDIIHLRRGWYTLSESERKVPADPLIIASQMVTPSYVSLEWALSFYGLIPEQAFVITSITTQKTQTYKTPLGIFQYRHIKIPFFTGFTEKQTTDGFRYFLAYPEKALVDFLYYRLSELEPERPTIFEQSFRFQNLAQLDWKKVHACVDLSHNKKLKKMVQMLHKWEKEQ